MTPARARRLAAIVYGVACLVLGAFLAQEFEAWYGIHDWPVALCPNYDAVVVSTNPWRIDAPTHTLVPACEGAP